MSALEIYVAERYNSQKEALFVESRNEGAVGVGNQQAPTDFYNTEVIKIVLQMEEIKHTQT